ncbi:sensor histidine kinase [Actinoallomurus iriomotensis]|uniref:Anti-sigma regulatory factor n=1 Tax=Actinoallomurus iriomotensis TaxID=478107 RepID=A0A9W6VQE2_9ACTN|nr:sensor histidine kinase [Actinoallomurus iriomotensis]GLY75774.1 anti-sigma regulatory factor [Actinoallomurus iriomotensis]
MSVDAPGAATGRSGESFRHPALFYRGREEYLATTVPFVTGGLAAGEPVAVAVPRPNLELLREALGRELGGDLKRVELLDMAQVGRNPGRIIPGVLRAFADRHPHGRIRIIGEPIWAGRTGEEYPACLQHEALINLAFAGRPVSILCPYDAAALDPRVLADAATTHPVLVDRAAERVSRGFAPRRAIAAGNVPLPDPFGDSGRERGAEGVATVRFDHTTLAPVRALAVREAAAGGLDPDRVLDVELAVNELAANSLAHGGGSGTLRVWIAGGRLVCEISDGGQITDPLAGRRPVDPATPGGRGLLLVNQLADLVRTHSVPGATTIRAYFRL